MSQQHSYAKAGVNIHAANHAIADAKSAIETTHNPHVLTSIGGFSSLYDLSFIKTAYKNPVLVQSIDGVGTKSQICAITGDYSTIGYDVVSAACNDIIVCGAKPLTLLDYIATDAINPSCVTTIIRSIASACYACDVALVGGETAEMPDIYQKLEHDIVAVATGIVEKDRIIQGPTHIQQGDVIIGIASSGLHTNGYSLARAVLLKQHELNLSHTPEGFCDDLGTQLLRPHINYTMPILKALDNGCQIHGMAHITGGGFIENLPRVLPKQCDAHIDTQSFEILPIFSLIQKLGSIEKHEMFRTFNMGIGFMCILPSDEVLGLTRVLDEFGLKHYTIGSIIEGHGVVRLN